MGSLSHRPWVSERWVPWPLGSNPWALPFYTWTEQAAHSEIRGQDVPAQIRVAWPPQGLGINFYSTQTAPPGTATSLTKPRDN